MFCMRRKFPVHTETNCESYHIAPFDHSDMKQTEGRLRWDYKRFILVYRLNIKTFLLFLIRRMTQEGT